MSNDLFLLLYEEQALMESATDVLLHSYRQCKEMEIKQEYTYDELDKIEAFTSRFARLSDLLIQKIFRLIDRIDLEDTGTVRDRIYRAEKKGLIADADVFIEIRVLRNDIAHEYLPDAMREIYRKVLELSPHLMDSVQRVKDYCRRYR